MLRSVLIIVVVVFSASVSAEEFNYNFVQVTYGQVTLDDGGLEFDGKGPGINASFAVGENFLIYGAYQTADMDLDIDFKLSELAVGYRTDVSPSLDIFANVGYVRIDADSFFFSSNDDGITVGLGVRGAVSEFVEMYGGLNYVDLENRYSETRGNVGFEASVTENIGVGLKATFWDELSIYQLTARLYFN